MKYNENKSIQITFTINESLYFKFKTLCKSEKKMPATVIKEYIKKYVDEKKNEYDGNKTIDLNELTVDLSDEELIKEKVRLGYYNLPDIAGLAMGSESLGRMNHIRYVSELEKEERLIKELNKEHERNKLLPEHLVWKTMHLNNMSENSVVGEYALIVSRQEEHFVALKFTIVFQEHMSRPMVIDPSKGPECYILFEKYYYDFYGPIDYPSSKNKWLNREDNCQTTEHELVFFDWLSLDNRDMGSYGDFVRCFTTMEEAKEYALCLANANSYRIGNRHTMITRLDTKEDYERRIERYEAYQLYRKYYKEIMEVVTKYEYPSESHGGGGYLINAILEKIPEITKRQLMLFWKEVPLVLEKRTQEVIRKEQKKSLEALQKLKGE